MMRSVGSFAFLVMISSMLQTTSKTVHYCTRGGKGRGGQGMSCLLFNLLTPPPLPPPPPPPPPPVPSPHHPLALSLPLSLLLLLLLLLLFLLLVILLLHPSIMGRNVLNLTGRLINVTVDCQNDTSFCVLFTLSNNTDTSNGRGEQH